jgi:FkbM family methyltransferase
MEVHRLGWSRTLGRKIVPSVGVLFRTHFAQELLSFVEIGAQILQGKGAGTGWDEEAEIRVAMPHLPKDAVVFDVGANRGDWSRNLLSQVKHPIRLFLFEPQVSCGPALADLSDRCTIVQAALGRAGGEIELFSAGAMDDTASVYERADSFLADKSLHRQTVPVMSLDAFIGKNAIKHISYMKLDVEGHELEVLSGAADTLESGAIDAIAFEFGSGNINSRTYFRDFWNLLTSYDYRISRITPGGGLAAIRAYYEDLEHFRGASNYLAVKTPASGLHNRV